MEQPKQTPIDHLNKSYGQKLTPTEISNEAWLQLTLDAAQMCAYQWDLKSDTILRSNRSAHGAMVDVDKYFWTYPDSLQLILPEDRLLVDNCIKEAVKGHNEFNIEYRVLQKDESVRWLQGRGHAVYDENSIATQILSITQDITKQKEDEFRLKNQAAELQIAKEKLSLALQSAGMVVIAGGIPGADIISPELCRLYGIEDENTEINFEVMAARVHPEDRTSLLASIETARTMGGKVELEYRVLLPNGDVRWLSTKGAYLKKEQSEPMSRYVVIQDITKLKETEEQVRKKNHDLSIINDKLNRFSSMVAHDLKNPLNTISMGAEIILETTSAEDATKWAQFIKLGVSRMATLIANLLEFAKTENENSVVKDSVSLQEIVETVQINLISSIHESHAKIHIESPLPNIMGHSTQLIQLFQNLISNALKFRSDRTPELFLKAQDEGAYLLVTLKDNGLGMNIKNDLIFEPFQRFHSNKIEGTGLGLSICKKIVELHGGKIWVEAEIGLGTTFSFTLSK